MKRIDRLFLWLAYRLPPRLAMWAAVRVACYATTGEYENQIVPDLTIIEALGRYEKTL